MARNGRLSPKQRRALAILLTAPNVQEAARLADVGERSLRRWLAEDAAFQAALRAAETAAVDDAIRGLVALADLATATLTEIMGKKGAAGVRARAALGAHGNFLRVFELRELESRLARLEELLKDDQS